MSALTRVGHFLSEVAQAARELPVAKRKDSTGVWSPVGGWPWWPARVLESYAGAWQQNVVVDQTIVAAYWAVFACATLIAKDISKLYCRVMTPATGGILVETDFRQVLQKPNHFQTRVEFFFHWMMSELLQGNTYVLKERDEKGFVRKMYVLCPSLCVPYVSPDGSVFYKLNADHLAGLKEAVFVPASEIIHDRMYTLHHPLIGVSPIFACGIGAMQGSAILDNSSKFFQNMSRPSGVLTAPGSITNEVASRLKESWETNFSAANIGRVAVLGDGLKYEAMAINAHDAQLIEQLKMTGEMIAACFHVPGYKIGVGQMPTVNNTAVLNQQYYDQCLQYLIEKLELRLNEGLEVRQDDTVEFDLAGLLRMDPQTRYASHQLAVNGGWKKPDEVRKDENLPPVPGGNQVYMQRQNSSLEALAQSDNKPVDGAQAAGLQSTLDAVAAGKMPAETAKVTIGAMFPLLTEIQINAMLTPLENFKQTPDTPPLPDVGDEEEEFDVDKMLLKLRDTTPETLCHA